MRQKPWKKIEEATVAQEVAQAMQSRSELKAQLHQRMDQQLAHGEQRLEKTQEAKDTTTMWRLISPSMEAAYIEFLGLERRDAKKIEEEGPSPLKQGLRIL